MVNKKVVIIATIITLLLLGGAFAALVFFGPKIEYSFGDEDENQEIAVVNTTANNTIEIENALDENEIEEKTENEVDENEVNSSNTTHDDHDDEEDSKGETLTDRDKAISLAKKEWGEDDSTVYYYVEKKKPNSKYIISVRSRETTKTLIEYEVDTANKTVEEY